jgi:ankyrin repeat protein
VNFEEKIGAAQHIRTPLYWAVKHATEKNWGGLHMKGKILNNLVKILLEKGAVVNNEILGMAKEDLHNEELYNMLKAAKPKNLKEPTDNSEKTNVQNLNSKLIKAAGSYDSIDIVKKLLADGAQVNAADTNKNTALMKAAQLGDVEVVDVLVAAGADMDAANAEGKTALMIAIDGGWPEIVNMLLKKGVNLDKTDGKGWTALMYAIDHGGENNIIALLEKGAEVNTKDASGKTPLMIAVDSGTITKHPFSTNIISLLLKKGAEVNAVDNKGWTALMWAVSRGHKAAKRVEMLLAAGAKINIVDASGKTALNITNSDKIKSILQKPKANQNPAPNGNAVPQMGATVRNRNS